MYTYTHSRRSIQSGLVRFLIRFLLNRRSKFKKEEEGGSSPGPRGAVGKAIPLSLSLSLSGSGST